MSGADNTITLPENVTVALSPGTIKIKSGNIELDRKYPVQLLDIVSKENQIVITPKRKDAKVRALIGTFRAHINNMIRGVKEQFTYKLKVCSTHFPMSAKTDGKEFSLSNFLGEKKTKKVKIPEGVDVSVKGDIVEVKSHDIEKAGMIATKIEQLTRLNKKDRRSFQDGIYMIEKAGQPIR